MNMVCESEAVSLSYYNYIFSSEIKVLFLDIGYCKTSVFQVHFKDKQITVEK